MPASDDDRTVPPRHGGSAFYRRRPGIGWLLTCLAVPLLLALIGWGLVGGSNGDADVAQSSGAPTAGPPAPSSAPLAAPSAAGFAPMSIARTGTGYALAGDVPDEATKKELIDALGLAMPGARIIDDFTVVPGVRVPDFSGLGGLFSVALDLPDFTLNFDGTTLTLSGTAPSETVRAEMADSAVATWPNVKTVNDIQVKGVRASPTSPVPRPGGGCATLQADVTGLLRTPITFATDGFTLASDSRRLIAQIADRVKACPGAKVTVVGHTDDTGSNAVNVLLSTDRAKSVADQIVSNGVNRANVTSRGVGAANPVADNGTANGRAQNRRVEITVS